LKDIISEEEELIMITLSNAELSLVFNEEAGRIESLKDFNREYVNEFTSIFKLSYFDKDGNAFEASVDDMDFLGSEKDACSFKCVYANDLLKVTVHADINKNLEWKIDVDIQPEYLLEWINFPQMAVPYDLKDRGGNSKFLWSFSEGVIVDDLTFKDEAFVYKRAEYPTRPTAHFYPAIIQTQFMSYFDDVSGLYFGTHDKEGHLKEFDFYKYKESIMVHISHFCGTYPGESYRMAYPVVVQPYVGEWQEAVEIYREWFEKEGREGFIPITENKRLPEWYGESPVVITYPVRGTYDTSPMDPNKLFPYCNAMEHIERLEKDFNSKVLVLLMHWEGTAPWAPPYVWPPYGGEEELKKFIDALHDSGNLVGLYCSGIGWTQYSRLVDNYNREQEFEDKNLKDIMCLSPKQQLIRSKVVPFIRHGYDMCPTQRFTVEVMKGEVERMIDAGVDYIQLLDQQHGGTSYFCYSKDHGHPPVPGKWQVDAVKKMLEEIEEITGKVLLGTESTAAERYIPYLLCNDSRFAINYSVGRPVPVYAYMFHEYLNNFMGNQVFVQGHINFDKDPDNTLERLAYSFICGDMLTVVLNQDGDINWCWDCDQFVDHLPDQQSIKDFVKNLNKWRTGRGKKYLHTGKMVRPCKIKCADHIIHCVIQDHETVIDKVHTSAWQAPDGSFGQFLVNFNKDEQECTITLPAGTYRVYTDEDQYFSLS